MARRGKLKEAGATHARREPPRSVRWALRWEERPAHRPPKRLGRHPEGPAHRRSSTLRATLERTVHEFLEDHGTDWAAALTYYSVLSVVPGLIALLSLVGLVALWVAPGYMGAFSRAANVIYEVEEGRPFLKRRPLQMCVTLLQVLLIAVVVLALVMTGPAAKAVGSALGVGDTAVFAWDVVKGPVLAFLVWMWLTNVAILLGAQFNAECERSRQFAAGVPEAERELQVELRVEPQHRHRSRTA